MEKNLINPWQWQDNFGYAQAVEVKHNHGTLYCSGQASINSEGAPVTGEMESQIQLSLANIAKVITEAGYELKHIIRLNIYATSIPEFFNAYGILAAWMSTHGIRPASTLVEVKALAFPELKVEIEATAIA